MTKRQQYLIKELGNKLKIKNCNNIFERDGYKCRICGSTEFQLERHHLTPKEFGGQNNINNLITLCKPCHLFMHCNPTLVKKSKQGHSNSIKQGLKKRLMQGKSIGRQKGARDKKAREKGGYCKYLDVV
jgi:hypothetical protein